MFRTLRFYHSFFKFLSTPSSRRATQDQIHHLWRGGHFYPRPPRGGRPGAIRSRAHTSHFYPRPPRGGRRLSHKVLDMDKHISIHALREEGDLNTGRTEQELEKFLSTPSARRATQKGGENLTDRQISIHALREEGDVKLQELWVFLVYFYPRPPRGGRHGTLSPAAILAVFLSTPSARRATSREATHTWHNMYFYPRSPRGGRRME